jgi:hypothetical protein
VVPPFQLLEAVAKGTGDGPLVTLGLDAARNAIGGLLPALMGQNNQAVPTGLLLRQLGIALLPVLLLAVVLGLS